MPTLALVLAGVLWGLFWVPMRAVEDSGLTGGSATLVMYAASVLLFLPLVWARRRALRSGGLQLLVTGLITGTAFCLYASSLLLTDVVRAILLFYMTPVWSTLLGWWLLRERIIASRCVAIALGLAGLVVILGLEQGYPAPRNAGDWMGLASGIFWAYGSVRLLRAQQIAAFEQTFVFFVGGLVASAVLALFWFQGAAIRASSIDIEGLALALAVLIVVFAIPGSALMISAARLQSPGRVGILLMGEVVVGVISAAVLTDEPFGARESIGALLIVAAGVAEVLAPRSKREGP